MLLLVITTSCFTSFFVYLGTALKIGLYLFSIFFCALCSSLLVRLVPLNRLERQTINITTGSIFGLMLISSVIAYFTSDNIIASYIDMHGFDSFRLSLLLIFFIWDIEELLILMFKIRSSDNIINIIVSFTITYVTGGSVLQHASYIIPYICQTYGNISILDRNTRVTLVTITIILEVISIMHTTNSIRTSLVALQLLSSYLFIPFHFDMDPSTGFNEIYMRGTSFIKSMGLDRYYVDQLLFKFWGTFILTAFSSMVYKPMNAIGSLLSTVLYPMLKLCSFIFASVVSLL